jgi:hypothetical protein
VVPYLALVHGSNEHRTVLLRMEALNDFLHEIEVFLLEHRHKVGREWDEKVNCFRVGTLARRTCWKNGQEAPRSTQSQRVLSLAAKRMLVLVQ